MTPTSPLLDEVAGLDAAGDHKGAINALSRAAGRGDLKAMTRLGKRLVVGDRAPYLPKDGASMVLEAAGKGEAEAVAQVAVFQAIGLFQDRNWSRAIDSLTHAARLGWKPAREQLLLLNGYPLDACAAELDHDAPGFWDSLAAGTDLDFWLGKVAGESLCESPLVRRFPAFIPEQICHLLIRQSSDRLQPALVYDPQSRRNVRYKTRTNSIAQFNLVENDLIHFLLQERMSAACGQPMQHMEATAILNYQPGEEISDHYDFVDPELPGYEQEIADNGQRVITFLIYLNDDYQGGETGFPRLGIEHKGRCGEGLFFSNALEDGSADTRTLHAGKPPLLAEKWIVSQFVRNRPVKYVL